METELMWLSVSELAELAEIASQNARSAMKKCFETEGSTWRGARLTVRMADAAGGPGGKAYQVQANSLPLELYQKFRDQNPALFKPVQLPATTQTVNPDVDLSRVSMLVNHRQEAEWKAELIEPALKWRPSSTARAAVLRQLADQTHIRPTDGKPMTFSVDTLRKFCTDFEAGGVVALMRKTRTKEAAHRYLVNRKWDDTCPLDVSEKTRIAQAVEQYVVDLWANGVPSRDKARHLASARLFELCRAAGWLEATLEACDVGQYLVERNQDVRALAIKNRDAKRHFDQFKPRVARERNFFPGEAIVGDVHPVDILLVRPDGSTYTPRMIAWYCLGTNRVFYTLLHPGPRQSVTQADIARSFFALCQAWGIPRKLYLDNGSEYKWDEMMGAFRAFALWVRELEVKVEAIKELEARFAAEDAGEALPAPDDAAEAVTGDHQAIVRAKPYNAPAKPIEGAFSALGKVLSMVPGYIGGDRMNKLLSKVGRQPDTFPGDCEAFDKVFADAVETFHNTPQRGFLNGLSPNRKAASVKHYTKTQADEMVFRMAFAEELTPKVQNQGIQVGGRWYYDDALLPHMQRRVTVRFAKWAPDAVILVRDRALPGLPLYALVRERQLFGMFDPAGAIEASRRESVQNRHYRELRKGIGKLDMVEEMRRSNQVHREIAAQVAPFEPEVRHIGMSSELGALQAQLAAPNPNPVERIGAGEVVDAKGEVKKLRSREEILRARQAERDAAPKVPEYNVKMGPRVTEDPLKKSNMEMAERAMEAARQRRRSDR